MKMTIAIAGALIGFLVSQGRANPPGALCPPRTQWDQSFGGDRADGISRLVLAPAGHFLAVGYSDSQSGQRSTNYGTYDVWLALVATNGALIWERSFGGTASDLGIAVSVTSDGGFIVGASSWSPISGNKTSPSYGDSDYWLIRVDANGAKVWEKSFGGSKRDALHSVIQTADGGFLLAGESRSPISGNKTSPYFDEPNVYGSDLWVVRTDAQGDKLWDRSYGGTNVEYSARLALAADGGFLLAGTSRSGQSGNKTSEPFGSSDYWILRLDGDGEILWQRSFGGEGSDEFRSIAPAADGGFVLGGASDSAASGNKTSPVIGYVDHWLIRIDADGGRIWEAAYGGNGYDNLSTVHALADGGFILGGGSWSIAGTNKTSPWRGGLDYWIVRVDPTGGKLWEQTYGGLREDDCRDILVLPDGGFVLGGESDSAPRTGKTAPRWGGSDIWLVRLDSETPGDCDGDGVPDATDQCPATLFGDIVDARGCGLAQACPCDSPWPSLAAYVGCLETNTARFVMEGIMTGEQRQAVLSAALEAQCPPLPASVIAFGLTNVTLGDAFLETPGGGTGELLVSELAPEGSDGVSLKLGQADSGVFISPYADIWGIYSDAWYMLGTAFGSVDGRTGVRVSSMKATKPRYETYPVEVDLSPLHPTSVTWQVWSNSVLLAQTTVDEPVDTVTILSSSQLGPRANPFWPMPDGSVGAVIELTEPSGDAATIVGPFGESSGGNRIFIRANAPSNSVDYISHVDVVVGGGLGGYSVLDERPGVFQRAHRVLGPGVLLPSLGRLQIDSRYSYYQEHSGVLIELRNEYFINLTFEPVALTNAQAYILFSLGGWWTDAGDFLGSLRLSRETNEVDQLDQLSATAHLSPTVPVLDVRVYRNGVLQGVSRATNATQLGRFPLTNSVAVPRIVGAGGGLDDTGRVSLLSFTLDRAAPFLSADGREWMGDHFQITATNSAILPGPLSTFSVLFRNLPSVAITAERSGNAPPPVGIARDGDRFVLSWPGSNLPLILEASPALPGNFSAVNGTALYADGQYRVVVPAADTGNRFFRLRRAD